MEDQKKYRIKKNDTVMVIAGKEKGQERQGAARHSQEGSGHCGEAQHGQAPHEAGPAKPAGGNPREGSPHTDVQPDVDLFQMYRPDPSGL